GRAEGRTPGFAGTQAGGLDGAPVAKGGSARPRALVNVGQGPSQAGKGETAMLAFRTILHPTDFSEGSERAFHLACSLARDHGARLVVLYVMPSPTIVYGAGPVAMLPEEYRQVAWEQLRRLMPPDPKVAVTHRLAAGDADAEILR